MNRPKGTVPLKETTGSQKTEKRRSDQGELIQRQNAIEFSSDKDLETYIINSLEDETIQNRIKGLLQEIMRDELSKMSVVLREAIRNWIFREKQKYHLAPDSDQQEATDKLKQAEADNKQLEEEKKQLQRELELKEHENKIILSAIKRLTPKTN